MLGWIIIYSLKLHIFSKWIGKKVEKFTQVGSVGRCSIIGAPITTKFHWKMYLGEAIIL